MSGDVSDVFWIDLHTIRPSGDLALQQTPVPETFKLSGTAGNFQTFPGKFDFKLSGGRKVWNLAGKFELSRNFPARFWKYLVLCDEKQRVFYQNNISIYNSAFEFNIMTRFSLSRSLLARLKLQVFCLAGLESIRNALLSSRELESAEIHFLRSQVLSQKLVRIREIKI